VCAEHHRQLSSMIDFIGLCADNLANADILKARHLPWGGLGVVGGLGVQVAGCGSGNRALPPLCISPLLGCW